MLLRLLPDDMKNRWEEIKFAIYESLPLHTGERNNLMTDILTSILTEHLTVWVSYQVKDKVSIIDSIATTMFAYELDKTKNLVIYTLYGYEHIPDESWIEAFDALLKWGTLHQCANLVWYTDNPQILKKAAEFNTTITNMCVYKIGG